MSVVQSNVADDIVDHTARRSEQEADAPEIFVREPATRRSIQDDAARHASSGKPPTWRPMLEEDVPVVAAMEQRIHSAPWTIGNFRDALAAGNVARVGEREGVVVAYGVLLEGSGEVELLNLSVLPEARRAGLGRALLRRFIEEAACRGAQRMFLEVRASNAIALGLYEAEGFVAVGRREGYYPAVIRGGAREAAVLMQRTLTSHEVLADVRKPFDARI